MRILDTDYIELESRRRAQLTALQWQTVTRSSKRELQRSHFKFVLKVFLISLLLFLIAAIQWWFITENKEVKKFFIIYNYIMLGVVFVQFLLLTPLQYVLRYRKKRSKTLVIIYMFVMTELCSLTLACPAVDAAMDSFIYAGILTVGVWVISFIIASIGHMDISRSSAHLALWCQKYFLTTSACLVMTMEFSFVNAQISVTLILIFFISIFFIIWGQSIGSVKFFRAESKFVSYYILLHYLSMISLMANSIVFIQRLSYEKISG